MGDLNYSVGKEDNDEVFEQHAEHEFSWNCN